MRFCPAKSITLTSCAKASAYSFFFLCGTFFEAGRWWWAPSLLRVVLSAGGAHCRDRIATTTNRKKNHCAVPGDDRRPLHTQKRRQPETRRLFHPNIVLLHFFGYYFEKKHPTNPIGRRAHARRRADGQTRAWPSKQSRSCRALLLLPNSFRTASVTSRPVRVAAPSSRLDRPFLARVRRKSHASPRRNSSDPLFGFCRA